MERFADELDLAQYRIDQVAELAIAELRKRSRQGTGRKYCIDCGVEIPMRRRAHVPNANRCVYCQEIQER